MPEKSSRMLRMIIMLPAVPALLLRHSTQFGFGGWNLDNVVVKIVKITDFATSFVRPFDEMTGGVYAAMVVMVILLNQRFGSRSYRSTWLFYMGKTGRSVNHLGSRLSMMI